MTSIDAIGHKDKESTGSNENGPRNIMKAKVSKDKEEKMLISWSGRKAKGAGATSQSQEATEVCEKQAPITVEEQVRLMKV
ncbi:conserved hypothetical protein [Ricinus communis]|uniref:Uncharacterized protein n=1 Tax=Ricinus communis TaxID=3988 RepID=B9TMK5_RICCO|nr:conserved hypothetical protein [Ricinus communis]